MVTSNNARPVSGTSNLVNYSHLTGLMILTATVRIAGHQCKMAALWGNWHTRLSTDACRVLPQEIPRPGVDDSGWGVKGCNN